jgi:hypothetical protein
MKSFAIPIVAAILLSLFGSSAHAQSPATGTKTRTPSAKAKRRIPPAPPLPMGSSKYRASAKKPAQLGEPDSTGRKDLAGKSVGFYPISKAVKPVQNSMSPIRQTKRVK